MPICGKPSKSGKPCRFIIPEGGECPVHGGNPEEFARRQAVGVLRAKEARNAKYRNIEIGDITTEDGVLEAIRQLMEAAATAPRAELKRIEVLRALCNSAVGLLQMKIQRELQRTLMRLEHGERAAVILAQLAAGGAKSLLPKAKGWKHDRDKERLAENPPSNGVGGDSH